MTWKTISQIGMWSLALFLLVPAGMAARWIAVNCYHAWRTWKQDRIELEALHSLALARARQEQIVRLQPDEHGFNGVIYDQSYQTLHDLDTGASWTPVTLAPPHPERMTGNVKQRLLAALSGSNVWQRVVQEIVGEEKTPQFQMLEGGDWLTLEAKAPEGEIEV